LSLLYLNLAPTLLDLNLVPTPPPLPLGSSSTGSYPNAGFPDGDNHRNNQLLRASYLDGSQVVSRVNQKLAEPEGLAGLTVGMLREAFGIYKGRSDIVNRIGESHDDVDSCTQIFPGQRVIVKRLKADIRLEDVYTRKVDCPAAQFLRLLEGKFSLETKFNIVYFGHRDPSKRPSDNTPMPLEGTTDKSTTAPGGYIDTQYDFRLTQFKLIRCLQGFGHVIKTMGPCYHNGWEDFLAEVTALQSVLPHRLDIAYFFLLEVLTEQEHKLDAHIYNIDVKEPGPPSWAKHSVRISGKLTKWLEESEFYAWECKVDELNARYTPSLRSGANASPAATDVTLLRKELNDLRSRMGQESPNLNKRTKRGKETDPRRQDQDSGSGRQREDRDDDSHRRHRSPPPGRERDGGKSAGKGGAHTPSSGALKGLDLHIGKWATNSTLKAFCFNHHVKNTCTQGDKCRNGHGRLSSAAITAAKEISR